jgi:predicted nucleic acid-binding protein
LKPIVADTGPLNYLIQVDAIGCAPCIFSKVFLPVGVLDELGSPGAPSLVREWVRVLPSWVEVVDSAIEMPDEFQRGLSDTDLQVLTLGMKLQVPVLIDDLAARNVGRGFGIRVLGTLGFLELAAAKGLLRLSEVLARLKNTNIHLGEKLYLEALHRDALRHDD